MLMNQKAKEKGADLLLDIIKYVITAVVVSALFTDFAEWAWYMYAVVGTIIAITTWWALSIYKDETNKKKNRR